jgi:opacity protein-like surface antigen
MKNILLLASSLVALAPLAQAGGSYAPVTSTTTAPAMPKVSQPINERFYIDLKGGALWVQDSAEMSFETGGGLSGAFGVNLGQGLSVELESGYYSFDADSVLGNKASDIDFNAEFEFVPVMGNVKYVHPVTSLFNFYVGAGLGAVYSQADADFRGFEVSGDEWDFAFQGFAGISVPMSEILSFDLGYRYFATGFNSDELRAHSLQAGINFKF